MQPQERINTHIAEQPEWQRLAMIKLRQLIHAADDRIMESWKGNAPHFEHNGTLVSIHALKTMVSVWFHKGAFLKDTHGLFHLSEKDEDRAVRKYKVSEGDSIHEKAFSDLVKQAVKVNATDGEPGNKPSRKALVVPEELLQVLQKEQEVMTRWEKMPPSHKREYVEWITDARKEETRKRRIAQALELIREGRGRAEEA